MFSGILINDPTPIPYQTFQLLICDLSNALSCTFRLCMCTCVHAHLYQGRNVPYARTQVLPHRFDNLKKKLINFFFFFLDFIHEISIMNL